MRIISSIVLVLAMGMMVFVGTAGAQDPVPSVTLVPNLDTGANVCTVEVWVNNVVDSDGSSPVYGPLNEYALSLTHPAGISVTPTPATTWFNGIDLLLLGFLGGASGCPASLGFGSFQPPGTCDFSYSLLAQPAVVGSGPIQSLAFTPGPGTLAISSAVLSTASSDWIERTIGSSINMETCTSPTAIGEPLSFAGSAGGGNMALLALAGLAMVSLAGLGLSRKRADG